MNEKKVVVSSGVTLVSMFDEVCISHSSEIAFSNFNVSLSFSALQKKSEAFASYLINHPELNKGDRIAIMMPNLLQYPVALFGVLKAGMVATNINPLYTKRELVHQLQDSRARAIVVIEFATKLVFDIIKETNLQQVIVTQVGDLFPFPKSLLFNLLSKHFTALGSVLHKNYTHFNKALAQGESLPYQPATINDSDIALLQYTGGTTGLAKGAILTHSNLMANLNQMASCFAYLQESSRRETIVTALPLYHIFSLTVNCLLFIKLGHKNLLISDPRKIKHLIRILKRNRFTVMTGVNTLFQALLGQRRFVEIDFSALHTVIGGGMAVHPDIATAWYERTGTIILQGYGLTETSPVVCVNPPDVKEFNGSVGLPLPETEVSIRDQQGKELAIGEHGELYLRGPQVMRAYWNQPAETHQVIDQQKWLRTGDIAYIGAGGYLYLVERIKNLIIVSGFNVYPSEIERVLCEHSNITEAACIGIDDRHSGQSVKAFVVEKKRGQLSESELIDYCKEKLTAYKVPSQIEFLQRLPKSSTGKILHRKLDKP